MLDKILVRALSRIRTITNSLRPIHRLPEEILSLIFTLVPDRGTGRKSQAIASIWDTTGIGPVRHIVPLTEVCHAWREILLHESRFWSEVEDFHTVCEDEDDDSEPAVTRPPDYTHYLHRNLTGPLYVHIRTGIPCNQTRQLLETSGHRIRGLSIKNTSEPDDSLVPLLVSFPADHLRVCHLEGLNSKTAPTLPLFDHHAPRLISLQLIHCRIIPSNGFNSLTHLIIDNGPSTYNRFLSVLFDLADLLHFLDACPSLQCLYIRGLCCGDEAQNTPIPETKVALLKLRKLSITGSSRSSADFIITLLSHLLLPPECLIYISPVPPPYLTHIADTLVGGMTQHRPTAMLVADRKTNLQKDRIPMNCVTFILVGSQGIQVRLDVLAYPGKSTSRDELHGQVADALARCSLFGDINFVHLPTRMVNSLGRSPCAILHALPTIEVLIIQLFKAKAELRSLAPSRDGSTPCPRLRVLSLQTTSVHHLTPILALVTSRRDAGYPLSRLALTLVDVPQTRSLEELFVLNCLHDAVGLLQVLYSRDRGYSVPEDLRWRRKVPPECASAAEILPFWPRWSTF